MAFRRSMLLGRFMNIFVSCTMLAGLARNLSSVAPPARCHPQLEQSYRRSCRASVLSRLRLEAGAKLKARRRRHKCRRSAIPDQRTAFDAAHQLAAARGCAICRPKALMCSPRFYFRRIVEFSGRRAEAAWALALSEDPTAM